MERNIKIGKFLLILLSIILFFNLFGVNIFNKYRLFLGFVLIIYWFIFKLFIKDEDVEKETKNNNNNKYIIVWAIVFGIIFLLIWYGMGMFYNINISAGFYINPIKYLPNAIINRIIPHIIIVIFAELIRTIVCRREDKRLVIWLTIVFVLVDVVININIYSYSSLGGIAEIIGCLLIPSICSNLLFNYMAKRYGSIFNILFRFITVIIYNYFLPILPDVYPIFESLFELVYPYGVYMIIDYLFESNDVGDRIIEE